MSDLKLFRIGPSGVAEIDGTAMSLEKSLQTLIEQNLEAFLGLRLLQSEFSTGPEHGGRMDTLGIDENSCPILNRTCIKTPKKKMWSSPPLGSYPN